MIAGTRLITVYGQKDAVPLNVGCAPVYSAYQGRELPITITYGSPCTLTVTVRDIDGTAVRRLLTAAPTRPLGDESYTVSYWDGKDGEGMPVPAGVYQIEAVSLSGHGRSVAYSDPVEVSDPSGMILPRPEGRGTNPENEEDEEFF